MNSKRKALVDELLKRYNISSGKRFVYSSKQSWYLSKHQRVAVIRIEKYLKGLKSTTISDIYELEDLKVLWPNNEFRRAKVQTVIMFLKSFHMVTVKCNNGYKIIGWNRKKSKASRSRTDTHKNI